MDKSCMLECPADCIYEGARTMYINPDECVDCGACALICRVGAIYWEGDVPADELQHREDNADFFCQILPGRDTPLGTPGGAAEVGPIGVDTPMVAAMAPQSAQGHSGAAEG
jgi:NAD-dependent dihydropyrimidine dehydrogenase PreA subunit